MMNTSTSASRTRVNVRFMVMTAMLSAIAFVLFFLQFSTPITPSFLKLDLSDLPALIGSFAMGPFYGVLICLVKNLLHLIITTTGGVGELSNFILGAAFVLPAGLLYMKHKTRARAVAGSFLGAALMAVVSFPSNLFLVYPVYYNFMPRETILNMYQVILPQIDSIEKSLLVFNVPFTFVKGLLCVIITLLIYKRISPLIKGTKKS